MPRPLLLPLLLLLSRHLLQGAALRVYGDDEVDVSDCPISFYGKMYNTVYLNYVGDYFVMCFNGYYDPATSDDCILGARYDESYANVTSSPGTISHSQLLGALPSIQNTGVCYVLIFAGNSFTYRFHNYGTQGVYSFFGYTSFTGTFESNILANGTVIQSRELTYSDARTTQYFDVSGCRHAGMVYAPAQTRSAPNLCLYLICSETSELNVAECGVLERCVGDFSCVLDASCTVTGPSVQDFYGRVKLLPDGCSYSLLSLPAHSVFQVVGHFRERGRLGVNFLDSVTLVQPSISDVHVDHNGLVYLDSEVTTASSESQTIGRVQFSRGEDGVLAVMDVTTHTISVLFNGESVQLRLEGDLNPALKGWCSIAPMPHEWNVTDIGGVDDSGCDEVLVESDDSTIQCAMMTERCNVLQEAPFSDCHADVDPEPYISACAETFCAYPPVHSVYCHFLEAYARVCRQRSGDPWTSWRSSASCPSSDPFCPDVDCLDHEFCGQTSKGKDVCFCRATFASSYGANSSFGQELSCDNSTVTMIGCLLVDSGLDPSELHLNDDTCRGQKDQLTHVVTFDFGGGCGGVATTNDTHTTYRNAVQLQNSSDGIVRRDQVHVDFSCVSTQPPTQTTSFRVMDNSVVQHVQSGEWVFDLIMTTYADSAHTQPMNSSTGVELGQTVWVELMANGLSDAAVAVVTDSCWATSQPVANSSLKYKLVTEGCADDQTVKMESNGEGAADRFSFSMFQFSGSSGSVYLHCNIHLCVKGSGCEPSCGGGDVRRRRAAGGLYVDKNPVLISLGWTT